MLKSQIYITSRFIIHAKIQLRLDIFSGFFESKDFWNRNIFPISFCYKIIIYALEWYLSRIINSASLYLQFYTVCVSGMFDMYQFIIFRF
jgi:hypothetical protein